MPLITPDVMNEKLIAPCGLNCATCRAFIRVKNKCTGCNNPGGHVFEYCLKCKIKNCENLKSNNYRFCFECSVFPCKLVKRLDKRYKTGYKLSLIENLNMIKNLGIAEFINSEKEKWKCNYCSAILSVHVDNCIFCNTPKE